AVHFYNILQRKRLVISIIAFFFTVYALFLTQSRAALIIFVLYIAITLLRKLTPLRILTLIILGALTIYIFQDQLGSERYTRLTDDGAREIMLETSIRWGTHDATALIFGNGYGSLWQWDAFM